ncbi:M13-type metalloendopeptidase [Streptomyces sp. NPDC060048]|uniref:M13-type metalloendopeptidase n=1 Tax=unclassified Streptomyces TaxID=2593676 RepID=UPI0036CA5492
MTVVSEPAAGAPALPDDVELDLSARPQDDFYRFVNGHWTDRHVLPAHRAEATTLTLLSDRAEADAEAVILRAAAGAGAGADPAGRRIADLYASFMDEDRIEELGAAGAFAADLDTVRAAATPAELAAVLGRLQAQGIGGPVDFTVAVDTADADGYVLVLSQAGLGLPAAAYADDGDDGELRGRYLGHLAVMWAHAGLPEPARSAASVLAVETALAARHTPARPGAPLRPLSLTAAALADRADGFPWGAWLAALGDVPRGATVRMRQAGFPDALDAWWSGHSLDELKRWVCWRYVHEMVPFGPRQVFADNFAFYGQLLNGFTEPRPRRIRAVSFVETFAGDAVGERYVAEHLAPGTVAAVRELAAELTDAYRRRLERADWMSEPTRAAALAKLDAMVFEIGSPRGSASGAGSDREPFDPADLAGNVKRGRARHIAGELARLGGPVDRSEWKIHPHQVTAYYRHGLNQVVVPAGLLQPPVFDPAGDPARNFAVLGSIIGHEMSHAFDSRGSRYDGQGRLRDWWAPADRAEFTRRTALLIAQYDGYEPAALPGRRVSGTRTVGENMADIAGVTVALDAYARAAREGRAPAGRADAHGSPLDAARTRSFLLHWATMWRAKTTPARLAERLASPRHPHPPAEFRCNGVLGHLDAFYEAFDVRPGDALFLDPASRFFLL